MSQTSSPAPEPLRYRNVRDALKVAFPALRVAVERLEEDWSDEPQNLGEYIVFEDVFGTYLDVLMASPPSTIRDNLLRDAFLFVERLTSASDSEVANLGVVAFCERIPGIPGWQAIVDEFAGPTTSRWLDRSFNPEALDVIIDLWGVREVLAGQGLELATLPGVSHPADHRRLTSLEDARAHPDGVVILSAFGTSHLRALARAEVIRCDESALDRLAKDLAEHAGGEEPQGKPSPKYFSIPRGERVWRMSHDGDEHGRLEQDVWVHPDLPRAVRRRAEAILRGETK